MKIEYEATFIEIEGKSEQGVKDAAKKLGFDYKDALFCSADMIYGRKYNLPEIVFTDTQDSFWHGKSIFDQK
ncbi:MAG: hypothetical protein PHQ47_02140 [Candidatus Portnoybacteria bacterium]|nr:hypothetical protein [Candidatus Portnoybacteria bacterium]